MPRPKRTSERVPPGTYERLVEEHGGETCWICGAAPRTRRLHIDHDHRTDAIRGLLCHGCNRRLWTTATPDKLRAMATYLESAAAFPLDDVLAGADYLEARQP